MSVMQDGCLVAVVDGRYSFNVLQSLHDFIELADRAFPAYSMTATSADKLRYCCN